MKTIHNVVFYGLVGFVFLAGCNDDKSKEIEALRKELAELKAKDKQLEETKKLQNEISTIKEAELEGAVFIVTEARENIKMGLVTISLFDANRARQSLHKVREEVLARANEISAQSEPLLTNVITLRTAYETDKQKYQNVKEAEEEREDELRRQFDTIPGDLKLYNLKESRKAAGRSADLKRKELNEATEAYNSATDPQRELISNYITSCFGSLGIPISSTKTDADGKFKMMVPKSDHFILAAAASRKVGDKSESYLWIVANSLDGKDRDQIFLSNDNQVDAHPTNSIVEELVCCNSAGFTMIHFF